MNVQVALKVAMVTGRRREELLLYLDSLNLVLHQNIQLVNFIKQKLGENLGEKIKVFSVKRSVGCVPEFQGGY